MEDIHLESNADKKNPYARRLNYKVIGIIFGLVVLYQYALIITDVSKFNITDISYFVAIAVAGLFATFVGGRYSGSVMFGKSYVFLAMGFFCKFIGDAAYYYFEYFADSYSWPTPFDLFYLASYGFFIILLVLNIRFFKPRWDAKIKALVVLIPILTVTIFSVIAYQEWGIYDELFFELFFTDLFVIGISFSVSLAILGVIVFRHSVLREAWLLLAIGIFLMMIADLWYYYMEIFEAYENSHPVNTVWMASFMIIIYALYKHHKVL